MALGQLAALDERERLVGQVEQAQEVRDRNAAAPDAQADRLPRQPELLDERGARARLLDGVEVLAGHVLDERGLERLGVVAGAHDGGDRLELGEPRRAPAALAGHQLVRAAGDRPHEHGLQHAALAQRAGERSSAASSKTRRGCSGFGAISSTGIIAQVLGSGPRPPDTARIAARPRPMPRCGGLTSDAPARTTSLASSKYASEPAQCGSWWITGRP